MPLLAGRFFAGQITARSYHHDLIPESVPDTGNSSSALSALFDHFRPNIL
jgi:hypothetical protein